jgi:hypothetical protein
MSQTVAGAATVTSVSYAIYARGFDSRFPYLKVSGGVIKRQGDAKQRSAIYIENANNVSIAGVTIEQGSTGATALSLKNVTNALVANNLVPRSEVFLRGADSAVIHVTSNLIGDTAGAAIESNGSKNWTIAGNTKTQSAQGGGVFFRTADSDACPGTLSPVSLSANNVQMTAVAPAMMRICGIDDYRGAGVVASGNVLNGVAWDNRTKQ